MASFLVCRDDPILRYIRTNYQATPLKIPENRIMPGDIISWNKTKNSTEYKGKLNSLLIDKDSFTVDYKESELAQIRSTRTKRIYTSLGLEILGGFLNNFNLDINPFKLVFKGVRQVSFSFSNVKRLYIDKNELGDQLQQHKLNLNNPSLSTFRIVDSSYKMMLIDSIITSSKFIVHCEKTDNVDFTINQELVNSIVADVNLSGEIQIENFKNLSFDGNKPLSFAFTSIPLSIDWNNGLINGFDEINLDIHSLGENAKFGRDGELLIWDNLK